MLNLRNILIVLFAICSFVNGHRHLSQWARSDEAESLDGGYEENNHHKFGGWGNKGSSYHNNGDDTIITFQISSSTFYTFASFIVVLLLINISCLTYNAVKSWNDRSSTKY